MAKSRRGVTPEVAAIIRKARKEGYTYAQIAAYFVLNQGALADVMMGRVHPDVSPADRLPPDFPALA